MPVGLTELCASKVGNYVYAVGKGTDKTVVYDIAGNKWDMTTHPVRPYASYNHACQTYNNKMYVFGGMGLHEKKIQVYDPAMKKWDATTYSFPLGFNGGSALCTAVVGQYIYVGGGTNTGSASKSNNYWYRFKPSDGSWTMLPSIPGKRHDAACGSDGYKVLVIGGSAGTLGDGVGTRSIYKYDIAANSWTMQTNWAGWYEGTNSGNAPFFDKNKLLWGGGEHNGKVFQIGYHWNNASSGFVRRDGVNKMRTGWWPVAIESNKVLYFGGSSTRNGAGSTVAGVVVLEPLKPYS
jgi:N-acetylneuraminic acid mutarotase